MISHLDSSIGSSLTACGAAATCGVQAAGEAGRLQGPQICGIAIFLGIFHGAPPVTDGAA